MEEIKFKAWHRKQKRMYPPKSLARLHFNKGVPYCFYTWSGEIILHRELILLQYVGRKDKHKAEIYNSDIIEITALTGANWPSPGFTFHELRVEVRWDNENALWSFNLDADWSEYYDKNSTREMVAFRNHVRTLMFDGETGVIIGNKFENPELLKED